MIPWTFKCLWCCSPLWLCSPNPYPQCLHICEMRSNQSCNTGSKFLSHTCLSVGLNIYILGRQKSLYSWHFVKRRHRICHVVDPGLCSGSNWGRQFGGTDVGHVLIYSRVNHCMTQLKCTSVHRHAIGISSVHDHIDHGWQQIIE